MTAPSTVAERIDYALANYPGLPPGVELGSTWLAQQSGTTRQTVNHWRAGREPSLEVIVRLAAALQVDPCWLAFGRGPMRPLSGSAAREAVETAFPAHPAPRRRQAE